MEELLTPKELSRVLKVSKPWPYATAKRSLSVNVLNFRAMMVKSVEGWGKIKSAAVYAGVSERTVENWLKQGLKCVYLPSGLRLIKFQWVDDFLQGFDTPSNQVDRIVDEVMTKI